MKGWVWIFSSIGAVIWLAGSGYGIAVDDGSLFSRFGSVLVATAVVASFVGSHHFSVRVESIAKDEIDRAVSRHYHSGGQGAYYGPKVDRSESSDLVRRHGLAVYLESFAVVVGTIQWGFGDLPFPKELVSC